MAARGGLRRGRAAAGWVVGVATLTLCSGGSRSTAFVASPPWLGRPPARAALGRHIFTAREAPARPATTMGGGGPVQSALRLLLPYPRFLPGSELPGPYARVGSLVRTRLDDTCCAATISFPAEAGAGGRAPYWSPEAVDGLLDYMRTRNTAVVSILHGILGRQHPSPQGLSVLTPERRGGWPVIVFSHGLAGCADMYTDLCRCLASYGYIVIALEHEDGSGVHAASAADGSFIRYKRPDSTPYSRDKVTRFRAGFLERRVAEIDRVLRVLRDAQGAGEPGSDVASLLQSADSSHVSLVGHSFGAAGAFVAAAELGETYPLKLAALLDAWAFSLPDSTLKSQTPGQVPLLSVLSEEWTRSTELFAVDTLLEAARGAARLKGSYFIARSAHQSFSDTQLWLPRFLTGRLRMRGQHESRGSTHALTAQTVDAHIRAAAEGGQAPAANLPAPSSALLEYSPAAAAVPIGAAP